MLQKIRVEEAIGNTLGYDVTKIISNRYKGVAFCRGHVIREEDVPELIKLGKKYVYIGNDTGNLEHENDAARRLAEAVAGTGVKLSPPSEGKVNLFAAHKGLLRIDLPALNAVNAMPEVSIITRHGNTPVKKGDLLAGAKVIPLAIPGEVLQKVKEFCAPKGIVRVEPFLACQAGLVITGDEVYHGLIKDTFAPIVKNKLMHYGCWIKDRKLVPDDPESIAAAIQNMIKGGAKMVMVTGGMAVDAGDVTPAGIKLAGADIVSYGVPVLPGSLLLVAYLGDVPVLGLPGCVMHDRVTGFDLILPRLLTGEKLTLEELSKLGHGGLCLRCRDCVYPNCAFGKC